jgi:hypothetical protein
VEQAESEEQLASFIAKFTPEVAALARSILAAMRARYPTAIKLVYDNYNALAKKHRRRFFLLLFFRDG